MEDSGLLQCVGKLKVTKPKPVGFLCGTLPVPTDTAFTTFHSAIVPIPHTIGAPRYQMLPAETDLNTLPLLSNLPEKVFMAACRTSEDVQWDSAVLNQNLFKKCEALAVSGLTEYDNEIDVVAPTDILKQVFKIPYSKAQLSVAVQRIGDTLILNAGPNIEEEEKLFRRQNNQSKCYDHSIFFNFAMHSVRAEACDCPSSYPTSSQKQPKPPSLPVNFEAVEDMYVPSTSCTNKSQFLNQNSGGGRIPSQSNDVNYFWDNKMNKQKRRSSNSVKRTHVGEKPRHPTQDSEQRRRFGNNGFLRVLFWQFHNFRMLLGSDMLLFSNDKYAAVSLHLWDVSSAVSPLMWLEAWLDNVMASVPELAICYHQNGVVQGYELLKTDDIFLLKGVSEDGIPAFHPQVVQKNGLSVLRFLQENCKQDPGAYWLYKGSGEDVIQLFDLSALPKNNTDDHDKVPSLISSLLQKGRRDTMLSLGTLLYRIAHRLSLSKAQTNRTKCAQFFKKCLDFLHEQDHMVVRAYAHEQFARFILKCNEELELAFDTVLIEAEVKMANLEEECSEFSLSMFGADGQSIGLSEDDTATKNRNAIAGVSLNASVELDIEEANSQTDANVYMHIPPAARNFPQKTSSSQSNDVFDMCPTLTSPSLPKTVVDPISSKLAAVHHVSQAIKYLRWKRQLQNAQGDLADSGSKFHERSTAINLSFCICGDANCIEICDIREWLPKAKMDQKMWNLVLLLGESYLALGEAYKEDGQLHRALKVVELACLIYGSMPQHLDDAQFISSMDSGESYQLKLKESSSTPFFFREAQEDLNFSLFNEGNLSEHLSSAYLFWPKAWSLIGDVYVEYQRTKGKEVLDKKDNRTLENELRVSNEVVKEVMRLKKKLGHYKKNCISCSLINCSCQSDRASSGNSASSSGNVPSSYSRKNNMKSILRTSISHGGNINATSSTRLPNYFHDSENDIFDSSNEEKHEAPADPSNAYSTVMGILAKGDTLNSTSSKQAAFSAPSFNDASKVENGGIFRFHGGPKQDDAEYNLSVAIFCYDSARKALNDFPLGSIELISLLKKKGWASNELGRYKLNKQDFPSAEVAFADAIQAFKEVSDHTNVILIYCNLGHGRRSVAEELVSKLDELIEYDIFQNAYKQAILSAKLEYYESLKHYGAAKLELDSVRGTCDTLLHNEVYTQFANTYLRLGMLLAKEGIFVKAHAGTSHKDYSVNVRTSDQQKKITSASEAFWEALSMYESLGVVRKQEAAFTHFQLATFHRDNCLKLVDLKHKQISFAKGENPHMKAKWYASLADKHWNKAIDFYGPMTHPTMYLNILLEQAVLSIDFSNSFNSYAMLEAALLHLLEGRKMVGSNNINIESDGLDSELKSKFWNQLQSLLKNMLLLSSSSSSSAWDNGKLREMYRMSLKFCGFSQLHGMHKLWLS